MVYTLFSAISNSIYNSFDNVSIYFNHIPQNFSTPSFFISLLDAQEKRLLAGQVKLLFNIKITYFPESQNSLYKDKNDVFNKLILSLDLLNFSGKNIRYKNLKLNDDQNLTITLDYEIISLKYNENSDKMQKLTKYNKKEQK